VAAGARELLRHREAARLVGADILCSTVYGVQTVGLVAVAERLGWDSSGYGLLIAAIGAGGVTGTLLTPRLARRLGRSVVQRTALLAVALSLPLIAFVPAPPLVVVLCLVNGAGALAVEVCTETALAEQLSDEVFARAYGLAFPASIAGIAIGSAAAAPLSHALGLVGGFVLVACLLAAYAVLVVTRSPHHTSVPIPTELEEPARA
jgi:MFS family permease